MRNSFIAVAALVPLLAIGCGGDSEPAKSADDAAASERASNKAEENAEKAEDKADAAAEKADAAADKAEAAP